MRKVLFDDLLSKIRLQIKRRNINLRMSISAGERLAVAVKLCSHRRRVRVSGVNKL